MTKVPRKTLDRVLEPYKPQQRVLLEANLEYPVLRGKFLIGPCYYTIDPKAWNHATDIEIQLCLNQLAYTGIAELIRQDYFNFSELNFKELQKRKMVIIESKKRFRKEILCDKEISGFLEIKNLKKFSDSLIIWTDFEFENKSCVGEIKFAIINQQS